MIEGGESPYVKEHSKFRKWFFRDRFSYFDLIIIFGVIVPFFDWFLSHLSWS